MQHEKRIEINNATNNIVGNNPYLNDFCNDASESGKSVLSTVETE